jgi:hypothetical protein
MASVLCSVLQKAAYLAEFHFKCERNPAGQTNYDWGYWFWILKVLHSCCFAVLKQSARAHIQPTNQPSN